MEIAEGGGKTEAVREPGKDGGEELTELEREDREWNLLQAGEKKRDEQGDAGGDRNTEGKK